MLTAIKKRLRIQFSLRALLICIAISAVFAKLAQVWHGRAKEQTAAVETIVKLGGKPMYAYQFDEDFKYAASRTSAIPSALRSWLGEDWFALVIGVELPANQLNDESIKCLDKFPHIQVLDLFVDQITDEQLEKLHCCTKLHN